jgi:hypothetical protein
MLVDVVASLDPRQAESESGKERRKVAKADILQMSGGEARQQAFRIHESSIRCIGRAASELTREIAEGTIVAEWTGMGVRVPRREMMAAAMRTWTHEVIEKALGEDAARVLPEAIRLVALDVRVPRYQRDMVRYVAERDKTTMSDVVARELEGMASAGFEEFVGVVAGFAEAMALG